MSQGRKAVARDLGKVYSSIGAVLKRSKLMAFAGKDQWRAALIKASKNNDDNAMRELLTRPMQGTEIVKVRPYQRNGVSVAGYTSKRPFKGPAIPGISGGTQIGGALNPNLHTARRNSRGHVTGGNILSQVVTANKELNDYRKKVQSRVGWHMAGWLPLARLVGAKVSPWVEKTRLAAVSGKATASFTSKAFVMATNFDVKIPGYQKIVDAVMAARIRVAATKLDRLVKGKAVNLGFKRIAAR